jgi:hypothetical protein
LTSATTTSQTQFRAELSHGLAAADHERDEQAERQRGEPEPADDQRRRGQFTNGDLDEQERGAPDQGEPDQHRQIAVTHHHWQRARDLSCEA